MKAKIFRVFLTILVLFSWLLSGYPEVWHNPRIPPQINSIYAAASVTTATGGSSISADTTGGSYTTLTGPTIIEGANRDVGLGTIVLSAPSGFVFNTGATVTGTITRDAGAKSCFTFSSTTAVPTSSTITFTVTAQDGSGGNPATICRVTFSNIQVRPSAGTPLASGNITHTGTASITGITGSTNLGTLTEVVGAKNKLGITTQPSSSAVIATDFSTKPVVAVQDQFGNTLTSDNSSTVTTAVVLSTQSCGGTAGSGTLTSTPASGGTVSNGVMTYTAMQYSASENIKICFSSSGITSALSNAINVSPPAVSISLSTNGSISFGTVPLNTSKDTTASGINDPETVNVDSGPADLDVKTTIFSEGGNTWSLGASNGDNQVKWEFSKDGTNWTTFTAADPTTFTFDTNVPQGNTRNLYLRLTMPTSTNSYNQYGSTVTIVASNP